MSDTPGLRAAPFAGRLDEVRRGAVTEFDVEAGLGVCAEQSGRAFAFHCTAIADGSREIAVGTPVCFRLAPSSRGEIEARDLVATA